MHADIVFNPDGPFGVAILPIGWTQKTWDDAVRQVADLDGDYEISNDPAGYAYKNGKSYYLIVPKAARVTKPRKTREPAIVDTDTGT